MPIFHCSIDVYTGTLLYCNKLFRSLAEMHFDKITHSDKAFLKVRDQDNAVRFFFQTSLWVCIFILEIFNALRKNMYKFDLVINQLAGNALLNYIYCHWNREGDNHRYSQIAISWKLITWRRHPHLSTLIFILFIRKKSLLEKRKNWQCVLIQSVHVLLTHTLTQIDTQVKYIAVWNFCLFIFFLPPS